MVVSIRSDAKINFLVEAVRLEGLGDALTPSANAQVTLATTTKELTKNGLR